MQGQIFLQGKNLEPLPNPLLVKSWQLLQEVLGILDDNKLTVSSNVPVAMKWNANVDNINISKVPTVRNAE